MWRFASPNPTTSDGSMKNVNLPSTSKVSRLHGVYFIGKIVRIVRQEKVGVIAGYTKSIDGTRRS